MLDLLYVAVPVLSGEKISGVVRLTYPASVVTDQVNGQLRNTETETIPMVKDPWKELNKAK